MSNYNKLIAAPSIANLLKLAFIILFALFSLHCASYFYSHIAFSILALLVFLYFCYGLSHASMPAFLLLLTYLFFRFTTIISGISIELGAEMVELDSIGSVTGATIRLAMVYVFFATVAAIVIELFYQRIKSNAANKPEAVLPYWTPWILVFFLLLTVVVVMIASQTGFPMITGVSRLQFREDVNSKLFLLYISNRLIFAVFFAVIIAKAKGKLKALAIFCVLTLFFISVLFGEKFSSIVTLSIFIIVPLLLLSDRLEQYNAKKLVIPLLVVTIVTIPLILSVYGYSDDPAAAVERLTSRFAGQGQLWFVADRDMHAWFDLDVNALTHNLSSFSAINGFEYTDMHPYTGAKYFMHNYMSTDLLYLFLETNALTLTLAFEPYLLMTNGWLGQLLPLTIFSIAYALTLVYVMYGMLKIDLISIFLSIKLLIWTTVAIQQGELVFMFGLKTLFFMAICMIYEKMVGDKNIVLRR